MRQKKIKKIWIPHRKTKTKAAAIEEMLQIPMMNDSVSCMISFQLITETTRHIVSQQHSSARVNTKRRQNCVTRAKLASLRLFTKFYERTMSMYLNRFCDFSLFHPLTTVFSSSTFRVFSTFVGAGSLLKNVRRRSMWMSWKNKKEEKS